MKNYPTVYVQPFTWVHNNREYTVEAEVTYCKGLPSSGNTGGSTASQNELEIVDIRIYDDEEYHLEELVPFIGDNVIIRQLELQMFFQSMITNPEDTPHKFTQTSWEASNEFED